MPCMMILLLHTIPILLLHLNGNIQTSILGTMLTMQFISFTAFMVISWVYIYLLYRGLKVQASAKLVLSVLLYGILAGSYYSFFLFLCQQLTTLLIGNSDTLAPLFQLLSIDWVVYIIYVGFGLKWAIPSANKHFLIVFFTYLLLMLILVIAVVLLIIWLFITLFQEFSQMITDIFNYFL